MINNIGLGDDATNVRNLWIYPKAIRKLFNSKTYAMNFPLKHPIYFTENTEYEKRVINSASHSNPFIKLKRFGEKRIKYLIFYFWESIKKLN